MDAVIAETISYELCKLNAVTGQPTPVLLPGESVDKEAWGAELDTNGKCLSRHASGYDPAIHSSRHSLEKLKQVPRDMQPTP